VPALQRLHDAQVVAVSDVDSSRMNDVADRLHVARRYGEFRQLLDDPEVEAVAVLVPTRSHLEVASAVLDARKHLLLEKPLALTLEECDRLIDQARQSPRAVLMGFNMRWHHLLRRARDLILEGAIGTVRMIRTSVSCRWEHVGAVAEWRRHRRQGGGALFDLAIHQFDLWRFLTQNEAVEVWAMTRSDQADDEAGVVGARLANGALACSSFVEETCRGQDVEVLGSEGRLHISCCCFDGLRLFPFSSRPGDVRVRLRGIVNTLKELPYALLRRGLTGDYGAAFLGEWRHFIDCVRKGSAPECTLTDGRRALEIVLAAAESASCGHPVQVSAAPAEVPPTCRSETS